MIAIIGGAHDGQNSPLDTIELQGDDGKYLQMTYREEGTTHRFYMRCGMTPLEALEIYKGRLRADELGFEDLTPRLVPFALP